MSQRKYGYVRDTHDDRDHVFGAIHPHHTLPPRVLIKYGMPPIYDQGQLGSCTANAIGAAFEHDLSKQGKHVFRPSRLFIYFNERKMEGTISEDAGAQIRDGIKTLNTYGVCPESDWPYREDQFATEPSSSCYTTALTHRAVAYSRVPQTLDGLKSCLAAEMPIVFGIEVFEAFESDAVAKTGVVPMPTSGEQNLGGHAILLVGYNDVTKRFTFRNSWGEGWGDHGLGYLPYDYVLSPELSSDFWQVTQVTG